MKAPGCLISSGVKAGWGATDGRVRGRVSGAPTARQDKKKRKQGKGPKTKGKIEENE